MAYVAVSNSPIHVRQTGGPVDPGYGQGGGGNYPSGQPLPPGPVDPGYGIEMPPVINGGPGGGERPDNSLPTYPVRPDNELPSPPGVWPQPPRPEGPIDPGYDRPIPIYPSLPIYRPEGPDNTLPMPPGTVWPPLPPSVTGDLLCFCWIVGVGYRWVVIDADAKPEHPLAPPPLYPSNRPPGIEHPGNRPPGSTPPPPRPDQSLPPTGEPKR